MGLKIKADGSYVKSSTGNRVFRYIVSGTQKELAEYKEAQGDHYVENKQGKPMFFTTRSAGDTGKLVLTERGPVVDMTDHYAAASLVEQFGGNYGDALAGKLLENLGAKQHVEKQQDARPEGIDEA